jgi:hypothetical protein
MGNFIYVAMIVGGEGPNVWDKEIVLRATDIEDALSQVQIENEKYGGWITSIEQDDEIKSDDPAIIN